MKNAFIISLLVAYTVGCSKSPQQEQRPDSTAVQPVAQSEIRSDEQVFALPAMDKGWRIHSMSGQYGLPDSVAQQYIQEFQTIHRLDLDSNYTYTSWEPRFRYKGKWRFDHEKRLLLLMNERGEPRDSMRINKFVPDTLTVELFVGEGADRQAETRVYVPI